MMPCPFLTKLPSTYVRNYASALMKQYAEQCPFLTRGLGSSTSVINAQGQVQVDQATLDANAKCPFLKGMKDDNIVKPASSLLKEDVFEGTFHMCFDDITNDHK